PPPSVNRNSTTAKLASLDLNPRPNALKSHQHEEKMSRKVGLRASVEQENAVPRDLVVVRVPATSANIGPGYDCLGCCVDMWSEVQVERSEKFEIVARGDGAEMMPLDEEVRERTKLVYASYM
ncbi:hypothetical protein TrLO_g9902, partial [Triparma laevis f. longispina]